VAVDKRWILGGLLVGAGIGVARLVTSHPKVGGDTKILFFGDSLAQGVGPHLKGLATEERVPYLGAGRQGSRIDQWVHSDWLANAVEVYEPTLVLISLGTNDAYSALSPEAVAESQRELLSKLPADADVVWVGVPALPETYSGRHPNVEVLGAIEKGAPHYYPSHELDIPRGPDHLHMTAAGYAGWAGALWEWLT